MTNRASSFGATPAIPARRGYGGRLTAMDELPLSPLGDTFLVEGGATVTRLPGWPRGVEVLLHFTDGPTFAHSSRLLMPAGQSYTFKQGDSALLLPQGDGAWRCLAIFPATPDAIFDAPLSRTAGQMTQARSNIGIPDLTGPGFPMYNGRIVESHAGNAATFAIKTAAGNDPSATDPVRIAFLQLDGSYIERAVTAATSIVVSSGSTLGMAGGIRFHVAIAAIDNAGTVELAVASRIGQTFAAGSNAPALYLDETAAQSTTAEGGAGGADSGAVLYSTAARAGVQARILARAEYDRGLTTAGTWAVSPSRIVLERPGAVRTDLPASFYAHKNNVSQNNLAHQAYTKATFSTTRFNVGGFFDATNSRWTPPAGLVELSAAVWQQANAQTAPANFVAKIWKNGTAIEISALEGWAPAGFANTAGSAIPRTIDLANGADYYELYVYAENVGALNNGVLDGNPAHTWFCGNVIR